MGREHAHPLPHPMQWYTSGWNIIFTVEIPKVTDTREKERKLIKSAKNMAACVKAVTDEDEWVTIQETVKTLDIGSGSGSKILKY